MASNRLILQGLGRESKGSSFVTLLTRLEGQLLS
jgi:hypothetical protein